MLASITKFILILIGLENSFNFLLNILNVCRSKRFNSCHFVLLRLGERVVCTTMRDSLLRLLTLRRLMSYIYMEYPFLMFLDHTQRRSTVGRTPLDE